MTGRRRRRCRWCCSPLTGEGRGSGRTPWRACGASPWAGGHVDDGIRSPDRAGSARGHQLVRAASCLRASSCRGLLAGHDQPRRALISLRFSRVSSRPAGDLADGRRRHDDHLGVVAERASSYACLSWPAGRPLPVRQQLEAGGRASTNLRSRERHVGSRPSSERHRQRFAVVREGLLTTTSSLPRGVEDAQGDDVCQGLRRLRRHPMPRNLLA